MGDVFGVFCGHDHDNDFVTQYAGVMLGYGRYSGGKTVYNHLGKTVQELSFYTRESRALTHGCGCAAAM